MSTMSRTRCGLIECNLILGRRSSCGARPVGASTDFQPLPLTVGSTTVAPVSSVRPGHLRRLRPGDANSRVSDGVELLCSTTSTSQHPPSRLGDRLPVACRCFGPLHDSAMATTHCRPPGLPCPVSTDSSRSERSGATAITSLSI